MILRDLLVRFGFEFDKKGADDAERRVNNLTRAGESLLAVFAVQKVAGFFGGLLDQASKAQDELNVMRKTFDKSASSVENWASTTSGTIGRSKTSLIQYAGALGSILVPTLNGNREAAAEMSMSLSELAVDLGSFYHMTDEEVMGRLRSGMLGSVLAVDQLGINLHDTALQAHAAKMGLKGYSNRSDELTKAKVRFSKIMADTIDKQQWATKTGDEYDNQLKSLKERIKDLSVAAGAQLIPMATTVVSKLGEWASGAQHVIETSTALKTALVMLGSFMGLLALQFTLANLPLIAMVAGLGLVFVVLEDIHTSLEEGEGYFADFFEAMAGKENWDEVKKAWKEGKKQLDAVINGEDETDKRDFGTRVEDALVWWGKEGWTQEEQDKLAMERIAQTDPHKAAQLRKNYGTSQYRDIARANLSEEEARLQDMPWAPWLSSARATDAKGRPIMPKGMKPTSADKVTPTVGDFLTTSVGEGLGGAIANVPMALHRGARSLQRSIDPEGFQANERRRLREANMTPEQIAAERKAERMEETARQLRENPNYRVRHGDRASEYDAAVIQNITIQGSADMKTVAALKAATQEALKAANRGVFYTSGDAAGERDARSYATSVGAPVPPLRNTTPTGVTTGE